MSRVNVWPSAEASARSMSPRTPSCTSPSEHAPLSPASVVRVQDAGPETLADDLRICADHCRAIVLGEEPDPELAQAFRELARLDMKPV